MTDSELVEAAYGLARAAHAGQRRKDDGSPYMTHPVSVASLLEESGADERMIAAALLHDVIEDTDLTLGEVTERFGTDVGELVAALTEDDSISDYEERKAAHRREVEGAGERAVAIYTADKLANLRDMRALYGAIGERAAERFSAPLDVRARLWREDLEMARRTAPELPFLDELGKELDGFDAQLAREDEPATAS